MNTEHIKETSNDNNVGKVLDNRYRLISRLGSGGMGSVYLARDHRLARYWAVKKIKQVSNSEIEALKAISLPIFPRITDIITDDIYSYIVMDYIKGTPLNIYCRNERPDYNQMIKWSIEIAEAISYLHRQSPSMLYMDCKPENIIVCPDNSIKLVDLGSVYICDSDNSQRISGTSYYAAPEQRAGLTPDISTDIYSYGMTLYELFSGGKKEYRDKNGRLRVKYANWTIPDKLDRLISKCCDKRASARYKSMDDLLNELRNISKNSLSDTIKTATTNILVYAVKTLLAIFSILSAAEFSHSLRPLYAILSPLLMVLTLTINKKKVLTWECNADIIKTAGNRLLYLLLISVLPLCMLTSHSLASEASPSQGIQYIGIPEYHIIDETNSKCLYMGQTAFIKNDTLTIKIPVSSLTQGNFPTKIITGINF